MIHTKHTDYSEDSQDEYPINELHGYSLLDSQFEDDRSIKIYSRGDRAELGIIVKPDMEEPILYTYGQSDGYLDLPTMKEILRYMEFIRVFGISVKHDDNGNTIERNI